MSLIFCDGFDTYTTLLDKWDVVLSATSNPPTILPGIGRGGAGAVSFPSTGPGFFSNIAQQIQKNVGAQSSLWIGFALHYNSPLQSTDFCIFTFQDAATVQIALWMTPTNTMYVTRGGTPATNVLGTAATAYPSNSFHYVEITTTISATVGVVQVRVDGNVVSGLNLTGQNTKASGNSSFDAILIGNFHPTNSNYITGALIIDDVYFDNAQFNGDVRVNGQVPSGDGTTQQFSPVEAAWVAGTVTKLQTTIIDSNSNLQRATAITGDFKTGGSAPTWNVTTGGSTTDNHVTWTNLGAVSHFKLVNEGEPDGDSSHVQSNNAGDIERFIYPSISGASVIAVVIEPFARKDDGGFRTIQGAIKSGSTLGTTGTDVALGTNYQYQFCQSLTDPNTGAAWTLAAVNAAEFGIKITN